jgi:hypothetical protein
VLLPQAPRDGDAEADFIELFKRRSPWWSRLKDILATVFAIVLCAGVVWAFFGAMFGRSTTITVQPDNPPVPGWEDLSSCSTLTSLDGSKELTLFELRQHAQFVDRTNGDNGRTVEGEWSYEGGKQYAVSIDGERTIYTLLSLGEAPTCMLIKGDTRAADLTASWFSCRRVIIDVTAPSCAASAALSPRVPQFELSGHSRIDRAQWLPRLDTGI